MIESVIASRTLCLSTSPFSTLRTVFLILLTLQICSGNSSDWPEPEFLVHPVSINTTEGSVVEFTSLSVVNSDDPILWSVYGFFRINDTKSVFPFKDNIYEIEFVHYDRPLGLGSLRSTIRFTATAAYNNCMIQAVAITMKHKSIGGRIIFSEIAILRVQGPLSSVVDLSYSFIDPSTATISWTPPFTLPGTNITGYNITASNGATTKKYFTSNSYYQLSLTDITDSPCEVTTISVSGYNGLNGESTSIKVPFINLPPGKISTSHQVLCFSRHDPQHNGMKT